MDSENLVLSPRRSILKNISAPTVVKRTIDRKIVPSRPMIRRNRVTEIKIETLL